MGTNQVLCSILFAHVYDPQKTVITFDGHRVTGSAAKRKYVRVSDTRHELHLQVTSEFLQNIGVGSSGPLSIVAHAGGDRHVTMGLGIARVEEIYVKELTAEVPEVVVVLEKLK